MALRIPYYRPVGRPKFSSFSADQIGSSEIDVSPITNALAQLADVWTSQLQQDRAQKFGLNRGEAALELRRTTFEMAADGDPATRVDRWIKAKDAIRDKYLKRLDEEGIGGGDAFAQEFEQSAMSEEFDLRKASVVELQEKQHGNLERSLDSYTKLAGEGSYEQQQQFRDSGILAIEDAVAGGILSPKQGVERERKFTDEIIETRVRRDILADPHEAERRLLGGEYTELEPDQGVAAGGERLSKDELAALLNSSPEERIGDPTRKSTLSDAERADLLAKGPEASLQEGAIAEPKRASGDVRFVDSPTTGRSRQPGRSDPYADLTPEKRAQLLEKAGTAADRLDRRAEAQAAKKDRLLDRASAAAAREEARRVAAEDRAVRLADKAEKEYQDVKQKEGDRLLATGELTPTWLEKERDNLSSEDYRFFYKALEPGNETVKDDPKIYAALRQATMEGGDPTVAITRREAYLNKLITKDSYNYLEKIEEEGPPKQVWAQQGESYISTALKPSDINPDPAAPQRLADTLDNWREWYRTNPDASPDDARKMYRSMVSENSLTNFNQIMSGMKGNPDVAAVRKPADLDTAAAALYDEAMAKHNGNKQAALADPEFLSRMTALEELYKAAPADEEPAVGR
jgi:hypothetical protein